MLAKICGGFGAGRLVGWLRVLTVWPLDSAPMRRQPSLSLRILRGLVVLVTVWCTGCSGFEPLLDAALGQNQAGMVCASEQGTATEMGHMAASSAGGQALPGVSALPASAGQQGFTCGCMSCQTVAPAAWSFALLPPPVLPPIVTTESSLVSVSRVPLLPPPERTAA